MLANPAFIFSFVWGVALFLYTQYWSNVLLPLSNLTFYYILISIFVTIFSWMFFVVIYKSTRIGYQRVMYQFSENENRKIMIFFKIWFIGFFVELLYFRDAPILALFGLGNMSYGEFGLPSLHGFLNAIILSISMYVFYKYIGTNRKIFLWYYILTLLVPIIGMTRGMLTSLLVQSLFVYIVFKGIKIKSLIKLLSFIIIFIYLFGILGEVRYHGNPDDLYAVFQISDNYPDFLPKNFIWVYMYIVSSINNIENIIGSYELVNFEPYKSLFGLLPSIIKVHLELPIEQNLVTSAFNVSSFMPNYFAAYGIIGSLFFYFFASLVSMYVYYRYTIKYELAYGFTLVILLHSITLSIFSDYFAIQVYVFQILIQFIIFSKVKINIKNRSLISVQK